MDKAGGMRRLSLAAVLGLLLAGGSANAQARDDGDAWVAGFEEPPAEARPLVFWQWVNGNVSEEGIRADLAWMQRIGLGGAFLFDIGFLSPPVAQLTERRIGFGSREWMQAIMVAVQEASRLGLSLGAQTGGGWSVSGGPDVPPEHAMKKLVWSETIVTPGTGPVRLAPLPRVAGPFQDIAVGAAGALPTIGGEIAVVALPLDGQQEMQPAVRVTGVADGDLLSDGRYDRATALAPGSPGTVEISLAFAQPVTPRTLTLAVDGGFGAVELLDAQGQVQGRWQPDAGVRAPVNSYALAAPASARWTVRFTGVTAPLALRELRLGSVAQIDRFERKAGFGTGMGDAPMQPALPGPDVATIQLLTDRLGQDDLLDWRPASGRWRVLRFGWSLTGRMTVPATAESRGLEVDKLDPAAVARFAAGHFGRFPAASPGSPAMAMALTDSWEAGVQNWSPGLIADFVARRGYDPLPWLPALAGYPVGGSVRAEQFLADWRRTLADAVADSHYGTLASAAKARGLTYFAEAPGTDTPTMADGVQAKRRADVPMGEYWYRGARTPPKPEHLLDIREAASAAHLAGKRRVAAEALTTMGEEPWASGPREWRRTVDRFFAEGVNLVVLHTSVHQPFTDGRRPGITLRQYGQHFTRNESWAELADGWTRYLARSAFLLQQGDPVADIAVFMGEEGMAAGAALPERPEGYDYDLVDRQSLHAMQVEAGALVTPGGRRYRALMLAAGAQRLSVATLERINAFVQAGGVLIGAPPSAPFGLADDDARFAALVKAIWPDGGAAGAGLSPAAHLRARGIAPDVVASRGALAWAHRQQSGAHVYFLANAGDADWSGEVRLRAEPGDRADAAEIWNAEDGRRQPVAMVSAEGGRTIALTIPAGSARFVVLRAASARALRVEPLSPPFALTLDQGWSVEFVDGFGVARGERPWSLSSWADNSDQAIRYYAGRAIYRTRFRLPQGLSGRRVQVDLGQLGDMARVRVNGRDMGVVWWSPAHTEIGDALVPGINDLEIEVASYWHNRLVGDRQPGVVPVLFATIAPYDSDTPLRPAGLIGPVVLRGGPSRP